jgi:pyruvate kinase
VIAYLERCCSKHKPSESNPRNVRPLVISKIENAEAVENFDSILAESDG